MMNVLGRILMAGIPWVLALAYLLPAPFIALQNSEGWGYLILATITFPAGFLFMKLDEGVHMLIYGNPVNMDLPLWCDDVYRAMTFLIFVAGGALWFFGIGLCLRRLLRRLIPRISNARIWAPNRRLQGTRHKVSGPLTRDVR